MSEPHRTPDESGRWPDKSKPEVELTPLIGQARALLPLRVMLGASAARTSDTSMALQGLDQEALRRATRATELPDHAPVVVLTDEAPVLPSMPPTPLPHILEPASGSCTGSFDPVAPWVFQPDLPAEAEAVALALYGDKYLAPIVISDGRGVQVWPDLLSPERRAELLTSLDRSVTADLEVLASARGQLGPALAEQLRRWASAPLAGDIQTAFGRWLAGARAIAGGADLGRFAGSAEGTVGALQVNALSRLGGEESQPELRANFSAGIDQALEALEDGGSSKSRKAMADFLAELEPPHLLSAVTQILSHWGDTVGLTIGRFGEVSPDGMFHRLFEAMEPVDRLRVGANLRASGFIKEEVLQELVAGRSFAGRWLPGTTGYAQIAAEHWAKESDRGSEGHQRWASLGGAFASTVLPETATQTLLVLAGGGIGGALALAPVAVRGLATGAGLGLSTYSTATSLAEALSGKDSNTGLVLRPEERLARILSATSGVLLLGAGAAVAFRNGAVTPLRLSPGELKRLNEGCARLDVEGLGPNTELWVPKDSPLATAIGSTPASAVPRALATGPRGHLEAPAFQAAELQAARSLSGSAVAQSLKSVPLNPTQRAEAKLKLQPLAQDAAAEAYRLAMLAGRGPEAAHAAATKAAANVAKALGAEVRRLAISTKGEISIERGTCFEPTVLDSAATKALVAYHSGQLGMAGRRLAPVLARTTPIELMSVLAQEVEAGAAAVYTTANQSVWEFADGTVVRYKPNGDAQRRGPTYSIEVKMDPSVPDAVRLDEGIAFKLDPKGRPVPKGPEDVSNSLPLDATERPAFVRYLMDAGHRELRRF